VKAHSYNEVDGWRRYQPLLPAQLRAVEGHLPTEEVPDGVRRQVPFVVPAVREHCHRAATSQRTVQQRRGAGTAWGIRRGVVAEASAQ
jgi:hypothetical protein